MLISPDVRSERGFSLVIVMMVMLAASLFVAAGFAAANDDLPFSRASKDRKQAYAAAEAGLNWYESRLTENPDFWTTCQGTGWVTVPGSAERYTVDVLPVPGKAACSSTDTSTVLDSATGTFRIRATGAATQADQLAGQHRTIVATFRRDSFLNFIYYTKFEDQDPSTLADANARARAQTYCAGKYRYGTAARTNVCSTLEIQFAPGDRVNGPLHSNDSLMLCGNPTFGRAGRNPPDRLEVSAPSPGWTANGNCAATPSFVGGLKTAVKTMDPPQSNTALEAAAQTGGAAYYGKTYVKLNGAKMTVTNNGVTQSNVNQPTNGVLFVGARSGACSSRYPQAVSYDEEDACGNVYISGSTSKSITVTADDVIVAPTDGSGLDWGDAFSLTSTGNALVGLIAKRFVRVAHMVNNPGAGGCSNASSNYSGGLTINAAILSLNDSFVVDNWGCGAALGNLNVTGAIAQPYRGPVGTSGGTGYIKDYVYDDRLQYRSPPYFLPPVNAAWTVARQSEQVPAS